MITKHQPPKKTVKTARTNQKALLIFALILCFGLAIVIGLPNSGHAAEKQAAAKEAKAGLEEKKVGAEATEEPDVSRILKAWEDRGAKYVFSAENRTDPFMPFVIEAQTEAGIGSKKTLKILTPLQKIELSTLKLLAVISFGKDARALVEDSTGIGYIVRTGTLMGPNNGKVIGVFQAKMELRGGLQEVVKPARVEVTENFKTYLGKLKTRTVVIPLKGEEK